MTTQSILLNQTATELIAIKIKPSEVHGQVWTIYTAQENSIHFNSHMHTFLQSYRY